jgi:23S rRNA (guanine745-N1)-methyltransferase
MKKKYELSYDFLRKNLSILKCPICSSKLELKEHYCECQSGHSFDIHKKGYICMLKNSNFKISKIYNADLFKNRRKFIKNNVYIEMYKNIIKIINDRYKSRNINILDLGCGEGIHSYNILKELDNYKYFGTDYSKVAINMATDYISENRFYFVGDVNNLPINDNSIDVVLDILSPYSEQEVRRILKRDGIFIKVAPGRNYLKELRKSLKIKDYEENDLITKKFKNINVIEIDNKYKIDEKMKNNLIAMTPIKSEVKNSFIEYDEITINLKIYVVDFRKNND